MRNQDNPYILTLKLAECERDKKLMLQNGFTFADMVDTYERIAELKTNINLAWKNMFAEDM